MWLRGHSVLRRKDRQAGADTLERSSSPLRRVGVARGAGLAQRLRGALVRWQVAKAITQIPAGAALVVGLAVGIAIGAALMLSVLIQAAKEGSQ